jgi:diguanylate cyclase (GGDEF)-like protein
MSAPAWAGGAAVRERFTIQARLSVLIMTALLAVVAVCVTAIVALRSIAASNVRVVAVRTLLSEQQDADMQHDALHADVLQATLDRSVDAASIQVQVVQDAERLRTDLDRDSAQLAVLRDPRLTNQFQATRQVLRDYAGAAERVAALRPASTGSARALLADFTRRFTDARTRMAALTDALRAASVAAQDHARATAHQQQLRSAAIAALASILLLVFAVGVRRSIGATLRDKAGAQEAGREANRRLQEEADRKGFETTLATAFEMAGNESDAYEVVRVGVRSAAPERSAELLLADNSREHLARVLTEPVGHAPGCGVAAPSECIAVRRGRTAIFGAPDELGSCPKLRGRELGGAVCAPVTFLGEGLGVLHVITGAQDPISADGADMLTRVAEAAGNRIGTLRSFHRAQLQASTDGLTGLLNRRSAEERVRQLQGDGQLFAVALCDLDHFKAINDTFGHEAGDRALRVFSATLRSVMRSQDVVARYGGEEFLLVMPGCDAKAARDVLERIRTELELSLHGSGTPTFTASFGLATAGPARPLDEAVRAADQALMTAKKEGRNRIVLEPVPARA